MTNDNTLYYYLEVPQTRLSVLAAGLGVPIQGQQIVDVWPDYCLISRFSSSCFRFIPGLEKDLNSSLPFRHVALFASKLADDVPEGRGSIKSYLPGREIYVPDDRTELFVTALLISSQKCFTSLKVNKSCWLISYSMI